MYMYLSNNSFQGDYVYWPKNGATSKVRRNEMPDKENWKQYPVRTFCSTGTQLFFPLFVEIFNKQIQVRLVSYWVTPGYLGESS